MKLLREQGYEVADGERRIPYRWVTVDLFGALDVLALKPTGLLGVQCTSGSNHADRVKKLCALKAMAWWLSAGLKLEVWSWRLAGPEGARKRWALRVEPITPGMLTCDGAA